MEHGASVLTSVELRLRFFNKKYELPNPLKVVNLAQIVAEVIQPAILVNIRHHLLGMNYRHTLVHGILASSCDFFGWSATWHTGAEL